MNEQTEKFEDNPANKWLLLMPTMVLVMSVLMPVFWICQGFGKFETWVSTNKNAITWVYLAVMVLPLVAIAAMWAGHAFFGLPLI